MATPSCSSASSTTDADAVARTFVLQHLGDTLAPFPPAVRDALVDQFVADFHAPLTTQLESVVRKRLTDDEVRHLLFAPTPEQFRFYAPLLSLRQGATEDPSSWPAVVRKRFLTLFYLKHARNWPLVVEFVLQDGLQILADLFIHEDLQVRGQAIDSFVQITSNPTAFEWFDAPVGYQARALHAQMVALAAPEAGFLRNIVANVRMYDVPDDQTDDSATQRLPGGTAVLLQLLAFFLSWVRKLYTRNELRLSRELLTLLRDWGQRTHSENEDEVRLAQQVYEDFSRWPAIEDECGEKQAECSYKDPSTATTAASSSYIALPSGKDVSAASDVFCRAKVNELMRQAERDGDDDALEHALALCSAAIDAGLTCVDALLGRAQVRLQRIQRDHTTARATASVTEAAQQCLDDCRAVLEREPGRMAAWTCRLILLETLEMCQQGQDLLDAWHARREAGDVAAYLTPDDVAYLTERRAFFDEKAHEARQRASADAVGSREPISRAAKQQLVYEQLLQRTERQRSAQRDHVQRPFNDPQSAAVRPAARRDANDDGLAISPPSQPSATPRDVLARFRSAATSATTKATTKTHHPRSSTSLPGMPLGSSATRAFVRQFAKCKHDTAAVRALLRATRVQDVEAAVESGLPEESLALVLGALVSTPEGECPTLEELRVLRHLLSLRRFQLMREMAAPAQQRQLDGAIERAHELLGTASAA